MKTCSFCGTQNPNDALTCARCRVGMLPKGASKVGTMKSIVEARRFQKMAIAFLRSIGGIDIKDGLYSIQIETQGGPLMLKPDVFSVHGRFQEVKRACEVLNPKKECGTKLDAHSGKWTHEYYESPMSAEQALEDFRADLLPLRSQVSPAKKE